MGVIRFTSMRGKAVGQQEATISVTAVHARSMNKIIGLNPGDNLRMTRTRGKSMGKIRYTNPTTTLVEGLYVTTMRAKVMRLRMPNFEWIDMFIEEEFPRNISYNTQASITFATDVTVVDSGHSQRTSRWTQPLMTYNVAYGVRTMEDLHALIEFFRVVQGQKHAFRFNDHHDNSSSKAVQEEARRAPPITFSDQSLGTGDEETYVFQLRKGYTFGGITRHRPIIKPVWDTVLIAVDGVEDGLPWECDYTTGEITFLPRAKLLTGLYPGTIAISASSTQVTFTGAAGLFNAFEVGDRVETFGFPNSRNNTNSAEPVHIIAKAGDGSSITTDSPGDFGITAGATLLGNIQVHPAPPAGAVLTSGFLFHVPVRFTVDEISTSLEYYGIGSGLNIKLMEVRPYGSDT